MKTKNLTLLLIGIFFSANIFGNNMSANKSLKEDMEKKVKELLCRMTLEEKIGQMTQINIDVIGKGHDIYTSYLPFEFDEQQLDTIIHKYKVGSILNAPSTTAMSLLEWEKVITRLQKEALATTGIPLIYGIDAIHGATYTVGATLFPQGVAMGATFNRRLVYESAKICAYETKASNIPWNFSPVLDLGRDPRWARQWETFGEDSYLVAELGKEMVAGYQGNRDVINESNVAACAKHYLGYGSPYSGKDRTPAVIPEHELLEKHFVPFKKAIEAGVLTVMVNSGLINGFSVHANKKLITDWLKIGLEWDGVVVSDWADINNIWNRDKIVHTQKEAIKLAINAGVDMSMVPYNCSFCDLLKELVDEGSVSMERIDDAVSRILRLKMKLNLFEKPFWSRNDYPDFASEKFKNINYQAACEAITLLKNNKDILPLKKNSNILVVGPNANSMRVLNGGWSYSWQGNKVDMFMPDGVTILKAIIAKADQSKVKFMPGVSYNMDGEYWEEYVSDFKAIVEIAKDVDYIVACMGENSYCETPGNLHDLYLSDNQQSLILELKKVGKPIILILNEGRPRIISKIEPYVDAVIQSYLPGSEGGRALADILFGDVNPSGKLPYTYPKYPNSLSTYDYKRSEDIEKMMGVYDYSAKIAEQWSFGYGLSYTNFEYTNLSIDKMNFDANDTLRICVSVKNSGKRAGSEAVLLYINDEVARLTPDVKRLRRFDKIQLDPGQTAQVTFRIPSKELAFVNQENVFSLEKGFFIVQVGTLSERIFCRADYQYQFNE